MPTYYLQPNQHAHVYQRPRAYSQSHQQMPQQIVYTHSAQSHYSGSPQHYATTYPQQASGAYYNSPQYLTPDYQYDPNRRARHQGHARTGSGGVYYPSSEPSRYHDSSRHSPSSSHHGHHSGQRRSSSHTRHHRSQSVPRQSVQIADAGRSHHRVSTSVTILQRLGLTKHHTTQSSSRPRQSPPHHGQSLHRDRPVGEPLSERIRRLFGLGHHSSSSRSQHRDYVDARTGRTVDWRGRPIYRV
ncbi:hypothetical protein C8Q70DRAFT_486063 [Cubamyces menziesii]|nr:hypothetical protein C8Q70DRAFT_486063 [Cubamyces menziesii]